ncbi:THAP domain-containing protein 9 [Elysia marginata]|uniref:THAP domain-containing protein 9 n=1 Tax=Elysia marginata TaxID=1093978 RepID=A0AAV4K0R3_9GAST|nr:THAP domain-containing protein 9 [Elysia marginata]
MSVKLAAETPSTSVADAIEYLREDKKMAQFKGSKATFRFTRLIDKLFDICNSRSPIGKYSKAPISLGNLPQTLVDLESINQYIRSLTDIKKSKLTTGRRKTAFIGFLVTIKSITTLSHRLLKREDPFKYLLTYKLSQDNLETLFSRIRRRGGWNNNPTSAQFKYALRLCMLKNGIRPSKHANCIEMDEPDISIIEDCDSNISSAKNAKYSQEQLKEVFEKVKNGTMSMNRASQIYGIPRTTLGDKLRRTFSIDQTPQTVLLQKEEKKVIIWLKGTLGLGVAARKSSFCATSK